MTNFYIQTLKVVALTIVLFASEASHGNPMIAGRWMLTITPSSGAPLEGVLAIEQSSNSWRAYVEGGPAPIDIDGESLTIAIDSRDIRGFPFFMNLRGALSDDELSGEYVIDSKAKVNVSGGRWSAVRYRETPVDPDAAPVDMTGIWTPLPGRDLRKYTMDLTESAQAWLDGYLEHYDQPNVRCASPGITAMVAWGAYPFEILASDNRLTFLYEFDSEVRRVFLDGQEAPEYLPHSGMGFSNGQWNGDQLHVTTTHLSQNIRDFRGEPVSEDAVLKEVYSLSEDGSTLKATITLHDPGNYERPPVRRRAWTRKPSTQMFPNECDPDSFYRQMYNEGLLDMYFDRSRRRF